MIKQFMRGMIGKSRDQALSNSPSVSSLLNTAAADLGIHCISLKSRVLGHLLQRCSTL